VAQLFPGHRGPPSGSGNRKRRPDGAATVVGGSRPVVLRDPRGMRHDEDGLGHRYIPPSQVSWGRLLLASIRLQASGSSSPAASRVMRSTICTGMCVTARNRRPRAGSLARPRRTGVRRPRGTRPCARRSPCGDLREARARDRTTHPATRRGRAGIPPTTRVIVPPIHRERQVLPGQVLGRRSIAAPARAFRPPSASTRSVSTRSVSIPARPHRSVGPYR
jgi:hypothetical protein